MVKAASLEKQYSDLLLAKTSPQSFLNNFGKIEDPLTMTELDFKLWGYQEEVLDWWLHNPKTIILKGRQLGISWVVMGFALWLANFHSSAHIVCISKDEKKAWKLVDKVKFIYDRMPEHLKKPLVTRNRGEVVFEDGSYIIALPSNPGNAVSYTATLVVIDEWAEQEYAEEVYKALKPIIEGTETSHGRFIGISTGSRVGTFFHEMWKNARSGVSDFAAKFLAFDLRPGRTEDWYNKQKGDFISDQDFYQQYPRNEVEAFLAAGGCPFRIDDINWYLDTYVQPPLDIGELFRSDGSARVPYYFYNADGYDFLGEGDLQLWELPIPGELYMISCDPATGEEGKDAHAAQVIKISCMEQVGELQTRVDIDVYTNLIVELGKFYNTAELIIERNNTGYGVINLLVNHAYYPEIYRYIDFEKEAKSRHKNEEDNSKYGWFASHPLRRMRDNTLIAAIREHVPIIYSERFFDEAQGFVRQADGSFSSIGKAHDDLITSFGMGYLIALDRVGKPRRKSGRIRSTRRKHFRRERWR